MCKKNKATFEVDLVRILGAGKSHESKEWVYFVKNNVEFELLIETRG